MSDVLKLGVIGMGFVGTAVSRGFTNGQTTQLPVTLSWVQSHFLFVN